MSKEPLYPHVPKSQKGKPQFQQMLNYLETAKHQLEMAHEMLDVAVPKEPRAEEVEDLFLGVYDRIEHIKEDIEALSQGRPFRHG